LPVENLAVNGGGFHHGILGLLYRPLNQPLPYRIVWILPAYQGEKFKVRDEHREVLSAAQGRCTAANALAEILPTINAGKLRYHIDYPSGDVASATTEHGAIYVQFGLPRQDDGQTLWASDTTVIGYLKSDFGDLWQQKFRRRRQGLMFYSMPLPTQLEWGSLELILHTRFDEAQAVAPEPLYLCRSRYLHEWPQGVAFDLDNQHTQPS
jgi:hypothetical protein